ncbi:glycosyltransferase family 4 protein [Petrocella sp. FN5]|uniref:glycosyltransferase family 4 protein n=1 Tax=Petrocella sp. FN5 TaxID=3032002 RepID=UPI0023DBDFF7|nr:glycosyltransferase family 4 protein [Petrocella sp. FN5]MDF1616959.1 glycosyltransferase family 4 protein [Petrocella sp. FN5]
MRVLYIATSFPEPDKGATIYTDLAEGLHEAGHEITVAVSDQARNLSQTQMKKERGFDVLRIVTGNYYDVSLIEKGITTLRIPYFMKRGISKYLKNNIYDFILYESPPVTNASLVNWAKKKYRCPSYLMLKDIFPQNAVDIGIIKKNSPLFFFFKHKEKKLYESADIIGCMSEANKHYIIKHNPWLNTNKIELFPNTKKISNEIEPAEFEMRQKYFIPEDACVFLFGGNMGKPQYVNLLCQAIIDCKNDKGIYFLFVGRGTEVYKLENIINLESIKNAKVIENLPRDQYEQITKESDVGLIILDPRFTIPNYPSRILSYMEYSKPVIAATDKSTDLKDLIETSKCGQWVCSSDKDKFVDAIRKISKNPSLKEMGSNGRKYLEQNFSLISSVNILEKHFN